MGNTSVYPIRGLLRYDEPKQTPYENWWITSTGQQTKVPFTVKLLPVAANGSVPGSVFSANACNELYPAHTEELNVVEWKQQDERQSHSANPVSNMVGTVPDLTDVKRNVIIGKSITNSK